MVRTLLGRMKRVAQQPFARAPGYSDTLLTSGYTRASPATIIDQWGNVIDVPSGSGVRRTNSQFINSNYIRNPRGEFSGGPRPLYWSLFLSPSGMQADPSYYLNINGIDCVATRIYGTPSNNNELSLFMEQASWLFFNSGFQYNLSVYACLLRSADFNNIGQQRLRGIQLDASSVYQNETATVISLTNRLTRYSVAGTLPGGTARIQPAVTITPVAGQYCDFTLIVGWPALSPGLALTEPALPNRGAPGYSLLNGSNRILIEGSATNQATNSLGTGMSNGGAHVAAVSADYVPPYPAATVYKGTKQTGVSESNFCNTGGGTYAANALLTVSCYLLIPQGNSATVANISQDGNTGVIAQRSYDMTRKGTWQRIYTTLNAGNTANAGFQLRISGQADGDVSYRCMLQIESGNTLTSYIPTSAGAVSRAIDAFTIPLGPWYFDGPKYTNLIPYSNYPTGQVSTAAVTHTPNATVGPFGGSVAGSVVVNATGGSHSIQNGGSSVNYVAGQAYTASVYLKQLGTAYRYIHMRLPVAAFANNDRAIIFDIQTGTIVAKDPTVIVRVSALPNGWFRVIITQTAVVSNIGQTLLVAQNNTYDGTTGQQSFTGDGVSGFYIYGSQIVVGSGAGPYIDNPSTTLNTKSPSDSFSMLFRGAIPVRPYQTFTGIMCLDDQTFNNRLYIYADTAAGGGTQVYMSVAYGGTYNGPYPVGTLPAFGTEFTVNVTATLTQVRVAVNGQTPFTLNTPVPVNQFTKFSPGSIDPYPGDSTALYGEVSRLEYVPYVMTDAQLMAA